MTLVLSFEAMPTTSLSVLFEMVC